MLAGIYWRGPYSSSLEALMASNQAKMTPILGPPMGQHNVISLTLIMQVFIHQLSF